MMEMSVPEYSVNRVIRDIKSKICVPVLKEIVIDVKENIAEAAQGFRGVSEISVADVLATTSNQTVSDVSKVLLTARIVPLLSKEEVFRINMIGHDTDLYVYVDDVPGLKKWVEMKYQGYGDKESILAGTSKLRIRNRTSDSAPLGAPERNFFQIGFDNTIKNKSKYGIT